MPLRTKSRPCCSPREQDHDNERNDMDDLTKECHDMARREILKRRIVAWASACYSAGGGFGAGFGANVADVFSASADDFGVRVGTSAGGGFSGFDDLHGLDGAE